MKTFQLDEDVISAMTASAAVLASATKMNETLDTQHLKVSATQNAYQEAFTTLSNLYADRALSTDEATAKGFEPKIKAKTTELAKARDEVELQQGIETAQHTRLSELEKHQLPTAVEQMKAAVLQNAQDVADALAEEFEQAAKPLIEVLRKATVLGLAVQSPSLWQALSEVLIPMPGAPARPIVKGDRLLVGDRSTSLQDGWQDDAELSAMHATMSQPHKALSKLRAYIPRANREQKPTPYQLKGWSMDGRTGDKRRAEEASKAHTATPAQSSWTPREGNPEARSDGAVGRVILENMSGISPTGEASEFGGAYAGV